MKKIISGVIFWTLVFSANAQWLGTNPVYFNAGNVGIGTSAPAFKLHIAGANTSVQQRFERTGSSVGMTDIGADDSGLRFFIGGYTSPTLNVLFGSNGLVGIGTPSPAFKLDVAGNIVNSSATNGWIGLTGDLPGYTNGIYGTLKTNAAYLYFSGGGKFSGYLGGSTDAVFALNNAAVDTKVFLNTNGNSYFNGGNVGIGTPTPGGKLHVQGSTYIGNENTDASYRVSIGASGGDYGSIGYGYKYSLISNSHSYAIGDYASQLRFNNGGFSFLTAPIGTAGNPVNFTTAMTIQQNGNVGIGTPAPNFALDVSGDVNLDDGGTNRDLKMRLHQKAALSSFNTRNSPNDILYINRNWNSSGYYSDFNTISIYGNVGIGTESPDAKLAVSGQVHAQEVKVSVTVPGPDYVFEKNYKLPTLEEIKTYIDQNNHLPEVPSAAEMEKNGVKLGAMNMLLLKKVEELTLYAIAMNAKMLEMKMENEERMDEMQKEIKRLKK